MSPYARKANEPEARARLEAFWEGGCLGRPALSLWTPDPGHAASPYPVAGRPREALDFDPDYHAHTARDSLLGAVFLAEAFPSVSVDPGGSLALLAAAAGGTYHFDGPSAWIEPRPGLLDQPPPATADASVLRRYAACVTACAKAVHGLGFVSPPTLLDPLTTLSQMAGPEALCMALLDQPETVERWVRVLTDLWLEVVRTFAGAARSEDSVVFWGPMTPGLAVCLQCDFAVMLSPDQFEAFARPSLLRMAEVQSRTLYHLDGTAQLRFLDHLATLPNCRGIQWNPETDYGRPTRHLDALRQIRARGLRLHLQVDTTEEAVRTVEALGPDGLFIKFRRPLPTRSDAEAAIAAVERASARHPSHRDG